MKHYLYKITNINTDQYYIGVRSNQYPETDKYMGSSSVWTKLYIKYNSTVLIKEILNDCFKNRYDAEIAEVELLKSCQGDIKCVNKLFDKIPNSLGKKQNKEWIRKRIKIGKESNMYGRHHTEETKTRISNTLKGRKITENAKIKIGNAHRNKFISESLKRKQSMKMKSKIQSGEIKKTYKPIIVYNVINKTILYFKGCKIFAEKHNFSYGSVKSAIRNKHIYLKKYNIIYAASIGDNGRKLGELLENLETENQQLSQGLTTLKSSTTNFLKLFLREYNKRHERPTPLTKGDDIV